MFARTLKRDGYAVEAVGSAAAALESIRAQPPDAVLLDLRMPYINGIGLLYRLRDASKPGPLAIGIVTGEQLNDETAAELRELGTPVWNKPLSPEALHRAVQTLLDSRAVHRD